MAVIEKISCSSSKAYHVADDNLPKRSFIFCNREAHRILIEPWVAGGELNRLVVKATRGMLNFAERVGVFDGVKRKDVVEAVFLRGGLGYAIPEAYHQKTGYEHTMGRVFLGIQRYEDPSKPEGWKAVASYCNMEALPDNPTVIIGDTIASGATMKTGLQFLLRKIEKANKKNGTEPRNILVYSLGCSYEGAKRIKPVERLFRQKWHGTRFYLIAADGLFHVMPNGTDLRYEFDRNAIEKATPEDFDNEKRRQTANTAVMPEETLKSVRRKWGARLLTLWHDVIGDWGNRLMSPDAHYAQNISKARELLERNEKAEEEFLGWKEKAFLYKVKSECAKRLAEREKTIVIKRAVP